MAWTQFMDMHSGGGTKEEPYQHIYIEAPEDEAKTIFYNRFGHSPDRVTCTCCGSDYSVSESPTLRQATAYERNCRALETPRNPETGRYQQPDDPWFQEHYYLEPGEESEARQRGYKLSDWPTHGAHITLEEYVARGSVLVIAASEIKDDERTGEVPSQGYVWVD